MSISLGAGSRRTQFDVVEAVSGFLAARARELEPLEPILSYQVGEGHVAVDVLEAVEDAGQSCASLSAMRFLLHRNGTKVVDRAPFTNDDRVTKQKLVHGSRL